ncbi:hypothetical protein [Haloglycomyces albus]|uniref:hypothetical protein n=1 Tax=Haloglycomyces albus TaxID=526067 RepID=UPI00046D0EC6|nr:hypothetical protein [Haloglycomyces albus]
MAQSDDDRPVEFGDDDLSVIPDQTSDDTDIGWGEPPERMSSRSARKGPKLSAHDLDILNERPPHWS